MADDVRFCDQCGSPRMAGHAFCAECGARFPVAAQPSYAPPPPVAPPGCPACGAPITPGHQFCAECGTRVGGTPTGSAAPPAAPFAAPPAAPFAAPPAASEPPRRRRRILPALLALVLLAAMGGAAYWGWRLLSDDDQERATTAGDQTPGSSPSADDAAGSPGSDESPSTEPVTCWDGTEADVMSECPPVEGTEGMRYAFPTLDENFDSCRVAFPGGGKVRAIACRVVVSDGGTVSVVYSEWESYSVMSDHYFEKYVAPPRTSRGVHAWEPESRPNGRYAGSVMYAENALFSFSATGDTFEQSKEAFDETRWRPAGELPPR